MEQNWLRYTIQFNLGRNINLRPKLNGEVFLCTKYHNKTSVFINNKLVVKENLLIQPSIVNALSTGQLEGFTHQASLIILDENADCTQLKNLAFNYLSKKNAISFGVSTAPVNGIIIRIHGHKAEQLFTLFNGFISGGY